MGDRCSPARRPTANAAGRPWCCRCAAIALDVRVLIRELDTAAAVEHPMADRRQLVLVVEQLVHRRVEAQHGIQVVLPCVTFGEVQPR